MGVVSSNSDPQQSGRVQIRLPWLGSTVWAVVSSPIDSASAGRITLGTTVVVAFERGDPSYPVVLGRVEGSP